MEIDRLSATVDAETRSAEKNFDRYGRTVKNATEDQVTVITVELNDAEVKKADHQLDSAAEDRTSVITVLTNDETGGLLGMSKDGSGKIPLEIDFSESFDDAANRFVRKFGEGVGQMDIPNLGGAVIPKRGGGGILAASELAEMNRDIEGTFESATKKVFAKRTSITKWVEMGFTDGAASAFRKFEGMGLGKILSIRMPGANESGGIFDIFRDGKGAFQMMERGLEGASALVGVFDTLGDAIGDVEKIGADMGESMTGVTTSITNAGGAGSEAGKGFASLASSMAGSVVQIVIVIAEIAIMLPIVFALATAVVALAGYVAGLVAAFAPLVGVLFALPALIMGVLGPLAIFMVVMKEIMPALQEVWTGLDNTAEATKNYNRSLVSLAQTERSAAKASEDYANARRDAGEAIEDAQFAATGAQLSEARAILNLERAYKRLADVQGKTAKKTDEITKVTDDFTGKQFDVARITFDAAKSQDDMKDALLGVKEAELSLAQARDNKEDTELRLRELERKGIENSDIVIDRALANVAAQDQLAQANLDVAEAMAAVQGKGTAYDAASEPAKNLVDTIVKLKPLIDKLTDDILTAIGPGLSTAIDNLKPLVDTLSTVLTPLADTMGTIAGQITEVWGSDEFGKGITDFFEKNADNFVLIGQVVADFSQGLMNLTGLAQPVLDEFGKLAGDAGKNFLDWTEGNSEMGDLSKWFELTATVLDKVFDIVGNLVGAFSGFVDAATPFGTWVLDGIVAASEAMDTFFNSVDGQKQVADFFERIKPALSAMNELFGTTLKEIVNVFGSQEAMDFLTNFTKMMSDSLVPAIGDLADALIDSGFLDLMVTGFGALFELISLLSPIFAPLLTLMMLVNQPLLTLISFFQNGPPEWLSKFWDPMKTAFIDTINAILDMWNHIQWKLPSFEGLKIAGRTLIPGWEGPTLGTPQIDYLKGGSKSYGGSGWTDAMSGNLGGGDGAFGNEGAGSGWEWGPENMAGANITTEGLAASQATTVINQTFHEKVDANAVGAATAWSLSPQANRNGDTLVMSGPR